MKYLNKSKMRLIFIILLFCYLSVYFLFRSKTILTWFTLCSTSARCSRCTPKTLPFRYFKCIGCKYEHFVDSILHHRTAISTCRFASKDNSINFSNIYFSASVRVISRPFRELWKRDQKIDRPKDGQTVPLLHSLQHNFGRTCYATSWAWWCTWAAGWSRRRRGGAGQPSVSRTFSKLSGKKQHSRQVFREAIGAHKLFVIQSGETDRVVYRGRFAS